MSGERYQDQIDLYPLLPKLTSIEKAESETVREFRDGSKRVLADILQNVQLAEAMSLTFHINTMDPER